MNKHYLKLNILLISLILVKVNLEILIRIEVIFKRFLDKIIY